MYVTSATGLQIYDVSHPATPRKLSQLPLPHFENEDVDVGRDTVVMTNDPSFSNVGMIYVAPTDPEREIVYGLDTTSGIHVLHIERGGAMATSAARVADRPGRGAPLGRQEPALGLRLPAAGPAGLNATPGADAVS